MGDERKVEQIYNFLNAYPRKVVEEAIAAYFAQNFEYTSRDVGKKPTFDKLALKARELALIMPICPNGCTKKMTNTCGEEVEVSKMQLQGICPSCEDGKLGYKSKYVCSCGHTEKFNVSVAEKIKELKEDKQHGMVPVE